MGACRRAVVVARVAVVVVSLGAGCSAAAGAAATWTVRPGGGVLVNMVRMTTLTDTATGRSWTCGSVMNGALQRGSGLPGTGIGSLPAAGYDCATQVKLVPRGLPWRLNLSSYDAHTGVSRGTISHLQLAFSSHGCRALINGTSGPASDGVVAVTYSNHTATLTILPGGGTLHWYHVYDCAHLAANRDPATLSAAYNLARPQTITSP